jgi:hypothetical protein
LAAISAAGDPDVAGAAAKMQERLDTATSAFPSLTPSGRVEADPSLIYAAAAGMELAARSVE